MIHLIDFDLPHFGGDCGFDVFVVLGFEAAQVTTDHRIEAAEVYHSHQAQVILIGRLVSMLLPLSATIWMVTGLGEALSSVIVIPEVAVSRLAPAAVTYLV